ncbi:hypothetical protein JB92DRAFT_2887345 [Gautieria morchelliformis]|nr:hypothetical protein JB92DRAFT_2887345 [Gautieria morchelliformis]
MCSSQEPVAMVFRALAVLVALPPLVPISPWSRRARLSTKPKMPRRVHAHRHHRHAADASWASELLRRGGYWDGEKWLQNGLVLCECWIQLHAVYAQAHRLRKSICLVRRWGQAGVRVECLSPTRTHRR